MNHEEPKDGPVTADSSSSARPKGPAGRLLGALLHGLPTLFVLAGLVALAWWGHQSGWKSPKYAQLTGAGRPAQKEDWCTEHNVPDSACIACHPELVGGNAADWCKEHGVAESKCTICHPEILTTGVAGDWCPEHGVPESSCPVCHEEIVVRGEAPASATQVIVLPPNSAATRPSTNPVAPRRPAKPDMSLALPLSSRPGKNPKTCQTHARKVQFASTESVKKAGIRLAQVTERQMSATLLVNAETDYDRTRYAQVASPVSGRAWRVEKEIGQAVKKGEVVALVESVEVGRAKAELLEALASLDLRNKTLRRLKESSEKGFRSEAELQEADAALKEARIKLFNAQQALVNLGLAGVKLDLEKLTAQEAQQRVHFLGLPESVAKGLDPETTTANLLPLVAPFNGVIVAREVVAGEVVEPSKTLFSVADTTRLWVLMDMPLADAQRVKLGQQVAFRPDGARDHPATGTVSWVSTAVDDQTRMVRVRADAENPAGKLLAKTFGRAEITIRETANAIALPNEAIQWEGCCYVTFVRLSDTIFQTRKLRIGARANGFTEVIIGVLPGEVVVTDGSHVLNSEILKANLGAGCTDH